MAFGWDGDTPVQQNDPGEDYELATRYLANQDVTITGVRVWASQSSNVSGRNARIWNTGGSIIRTVDIDDTLPTTGWTSYDLATPLEVSSGTSIDVSYSTLQYYGAIAGDYPNDSADGFVTATRGAFIPTAGQFPDQVTSSFYGIDIIYNLTGGNLPPEITGMVIQKADDTIQATVTVSDELPASVTIDWDWGDGSETSTGAGVVTAQHTYSSSGLYAVLATATDASGETGSFAKAVNITIPTAYTSSEALFDDLFDAVVSDVQASGYFTKVNNHEPKKAPPDGKLSAAVWLAGIRPIQLSGLAATSAVITFTIRIYQNFLAEPQDMIDPRMAKAITNIMRRYHDDFDFEGLIRNVDLLGQFGQALSADTGYLEIDGTMFRVGDITVPCVVNDVWPQVS